MNEHSKQLILVCTTIAGIFIIVSAVHDISTIINVLMLNCFGTVASFFSNVEKAFTTLVMAGESIITSNISVKDAIHDSLVFLIEVANSPNIFWIVYLILLIYRGRWLVLALLQSCESFSKFLLILYVKSTSEQLNFDLFK